MLNDVQNNLTKLSKEKNVLTAYQADEKGLRDATPEAIILAMYDVSELAEDEKAMISIFAVLPNERISFQVLEVLLPDTEIEDSLLSLAQKGWIEHNTDDQSFKVNQVVQDVVKEKHKERLLSDCALIVSTLIDVLKDQDIHHKDNAAFGLNMIRYAESVLDSLLHYDQNTYVLCNYIGNYYDTTGDLIKAMEAYHKYEKMCKALLLVEPKNPEFKNDLAISYSKLGSTHTSLGNLDKALKYFEDFSKMFGELYEAYPQNVSFKNGLAVSYSKLGETHTSLGNLDKALKYFEDRSRIGEELYEAYPQNVSFKNGLAVSYSDLGCFYRDQKENLPKAKSYFELCFKLWKELSNQHPGYLEFKNNYEWAEEALRSIE